MKHTEYLKKKKRRESRKRIISILAAFVVFVATYALVLPALTLDVNTARMEPGMSVQQSADPEAVSAPESSEVEEAEPEEEKSVEAEEPADEEKPEKEEASSVEEESAKDEEAAKEEQVSEEQADSAAAQKEEPSSKEDQDDAAAANTDAAAESVDQTGSDAADENAEAAAADEADAFKVPELEAIDFSEILTDKTDFYYYHVDKDEDAAAVSSTDIDDWKKVKDDTVLAPEDFVRVYLAYTIPAGALNETNAVARYRLPDGLELTDKQIKAINKNENGISGKDKDAADYKKYLGAEAIEGTRTPDKDRSDEEYISATVKAEKVYKDDKYIGQDLVFTFAPYTVQKNQIGYDEKGNVKSEGKAVKGWFSFDLTPSRIGFEEIKKESAEDEADAEDDIDLVRSEAKITFVKENKKKDIDEICRELALEAPAGAVADKDQEEAEQAEQKTLTFEGADYTVVINYTEDAQIPDNAELAVSEIEKGTDEYNDYLKQAEDAVDEDKTVNEARFFDITILADGEKIEPVAPVNVQINFAGIEQTKAEDTQLLHYTEDEVQVMDKAEFGKSEEPENDAKAVDTVQFETDGFSVFGIVGTEKLTTQFVTAEGETYTITVTYGPEAGIPEDAWLDVNEISEESEEYQDYIAQTEAALGISSQDSTDISDEPDPDAVPALPILGSDEYEEADVNDGVVVKLLENKTKDEITFARFFDIKIMTDQGEIEPKASVDVKIEYVDPVTVKETDALQAVHFATTGTEIIDIETEEEEISELVFSQGSFSVTGTIVTSGGNWPTSGQQYVLVFSNTNNDTYYAIKHDGTVTPVSHSGNSIQFTGENVSVINDYLWTYSRNNNNNNRVSYTAGGITTYLKPSESSCIGTDTTNRNLSRSSDGKIYSNNYYVGLSGTRLARQNNSDNGVIIQFATAFSVDGDQKITVHYVNEAGDIIAEDRNILETTNASSAANYHNSYLYGNVYDLYRHIDGYAYLSTHLDSRDGTLINSEVVFDNQNSYNYRNGSNAAPPTRDEMIHTAVNKWMYQEPNAELVEHPKDQITQYDLKPFANEADVYVVYKEGEESIPGHSGGGGGSGESLDEPKPEKHVRPNGDGTYEMTLSVNASSKPISKTHGANVIIVFDMSASMSGNRIYNNGPYRLDAAKQAARDVGTRLLSLNSPNKTLVEMKVIPFDMGVHNESGWFTTAGTNDTSNNNQDQWNGYINSHMGSTNAGTNWEVAIKRAKKAAEDKYAVDHEDTYIIFITDGNPWVGAGTDSGAGMMPHSHDAAPANYLQMGAYFYTTEPARQIVQSGYELYGIGIYGNVDVLHYLMNFAYTGRSTYDPTENTYGHYYPAQQQEQLIQALSDIASTIEGNLAMAGAEFKDGIAADTTHTSMATSGGSVSGITYSKTGGTTASFTVKLINGTPMFSINGGTAQPGEIVTGQYDKPTGNGSETTKVNATVYQLVVGTGNNAVTYQMPAVSVVHDDPTNVDNLDWDLSPLGVLENGATYTISTVIWPDQDVYDLVADLNNGTATVAWNDSIARDVTTVDGTTYRAGGIADLPNVIKIGNTYAALSNTYQTFDYYVADTEDGDTTYTKPEQIELPFPKPMDLTSTLSKLEKKWNVELQRSQLVRYLYNTETGASKKISLPFIVIQDKGTNKENEYKTVNLGWSTTANDYVWEDKKVDVTVDGRIYQVGSIWADDFALATGIMLSETRMNVLGLDKTAYPSGTFGGTKYYILESGHDYDIEEPPIGSYRFDFETQTYHPMLVDGTLKSVNYTISGKDVTFSYMTPEDGKLSSLRGENTLRGGINLNKIVVDQNNNEIDPDTKFEFTINLNNTKEGLFTGDNTPWYAVNNMYYHDRDGNYISEAEAITLYGDKATADAEGGNVLMADADGRTASATLKITSTDTLRIANVPAGTTYSIVESESLGYELISIDKKIEIEGSTPEIITEGINVSTRTVTGEIVPNRENNITFTNKRTGIQIRLLKVDAANEETKLDGVAFDLYSDANHTTKVNTESIITANGGLADLGLLAQGKYYLEETNAKDGYNKLENDIVITVSGTSVTYTQAEYDGGRPQTAVNEDNVYTIIVRNSTGYELPHTGGPGTFLYTLCGIVLIMASVLMYGFRMRRRERRSK